MYPLVVANRVARSSLFLYFFRYCVFSYVYFIVYFGFIF